MDFRIRAAVERDYDDLCEVIAWVDDLHRDRLPDRFRAAPGPARSRAFIFDAIDAPDIGLFVAEVESSLVGFIHIVIKETPDIPIFVERRYAAVDSLAVREEYGRRGIGRALMDRAQVWARTRGATSIELTVYAFNGPAIAFYREVGYEILSHRVWKPLAS